MKKYLIFINLFQLIGISVSIAQIPLYEQFVVIKNEATINTENLEYSPAFYRDGLVFVSTQQPSLKKSTIDKNIDNNLMSIYSAKRDSEGFLEKPEALSSDLLSKYHEGPLTFDRSNTTIYFSRNNTKKEKIKKRRMKIYAAKSSGGNWESAKELPFNDDEYETEHPSISVDDDALYFSSNRPGGQGGFDIWVAYKNGESWSEPINLGPTVNSKENDVFPFIAADGTLYFSSNGREGKGQLDIFYTKKEGEAWLEPVNLEVPFNTAFDDFGLIVDRDNKNGYFSSNRKGGLGADDIYNFHMIGEGGPSDLKKQIAEVEKQQTDFQITDSEGNPVEGAKISYINLDEVTLGEAVNPSEPGESGILKLKPAGDGASYLIDFDRSSVADQSAEGQITLPKGNVVVKVEKEGFQPQYLTVNPEMLEGGLLVEMIREGDCVPFQTTVLSAGSQNLPVSGATILITNTATSKQTVLVTDALGSASYCLKCDQTYNVVATSGRNIALFQSISTKGCDKTGSQATFYLEPEGGSALVAGTIIQLPNIYFNFNDASLRPDARKDLDAVAAFLQKFPEIKADLASHTDARGPAGYNKGLSKKRSENVVDYLVGQGISGQRVKAIGYGESQIRNRCGNGVRCSEKEHQQNRRTEVIIKNILSDEPESMKSANQFADSGSESIAAPVKTSTLEFAKTEKAGKYFVVAGSFREPNNAFEQYQRLRDLGYPETHIIQFEKMKLKSVCVGSYDDETQAISLARQIKKDHQIQTFVKGL